jgi:hypothetical protein
MNNWILGFKKISDAVPEFTDGGIITFNWIEEGYEGGINEFQHHPNFEKVKDFLIEEKILLEEALDLGYLFWGYVANKNQRNWYVRTPTDKWVNYFVWNTDEPIRVITKLS